VLSPEILKTETKLRSASGRSTKRPSTLNDIRCTETTYGMNSVISKLITFVENAETSRFLFLIILILSCYTCSLRQQFLSYDLTLFFLMQCNTSCFSFG
jgi:hypothetical protein